MGRKISRAESWSTVYKAFQNINFSAYDFTTIKRSLTDYIQLYHSENFNDYIENSEVIAQIESFAYVAEILAYRQDMNAHENFFGLAERKDSILQLAKFISYNASRNLAPRGLIKLTSVQTTQESSDSKGNSLANKKITWNDTNNSDWKEQFFILMNLVMQQQYGSVSPNDRVQVDDVLFELYRLKNRPLTNGVFGYSASSNGESYSMELVPTALNSSGPYERRPDTTSPFSILYGSDGLGDSSDTTGFFCFTKQGRLNKVRKMYDGITPNQTTRLNVKDVNETDLWVNNVDSDTGKTFTAQIVDELGRRLGASGEWVQVDIANVENVIFNTNLKRNKFEVETLDNDDVRIIYGDGEFADIPSGAFDIWYRTSTAGSGIILQNSVVNKSASFTYLDDQQKLQTFTFTFSLVNSLVNGAGTEDIERIRRFAPSIFYTQDRMVNGRDYNSYPLQDQSIAKLRAINRTFAGDSKYLAWHDPSEYYEDVKIFGDDLALFYKTSVDQVPSVGSQPLKMVRDVLQPLLTYAGVYMYHTSIGKDVPLREFTATDLGVSELSAHNTILGEIAKGMDRNDDFTIYMCYRPVYAVGSAMPLKYQWMTYNTSDTEYSDVNPSGEPSIEREATFTIDYDYSESKWTINFKTTAIMSYSPTTQFYFNNGLTKVLVNDTLNSALDNLIILGANINASGGLIGENVKLNVIGNPYSDWLPNTGQTDMNTLSVITADDNDDGVPDNTSLPNVVRSPAQITSLPVSGAFPRKPIVNVTVSGVKAGLDELSVYVNGKKFIRCITDGSSQTGYSFPKQFNESYELKDNEPEAKRWYDPEPSETFYQYIELHNGRQAADGEEVTAIQLIMPNDKSSLTAPKYIEYNAFINRGPTYTVSIQRVQFAYFTRSGSTTTDWAPVVYKDIDNARSAWLDPLQRITKRRYTGRTGLNFAWFHRTPRYHLVDPSATNLIDMFVVTRAYYEQVRRWLRGEAPIPAAPTSLDLRSSYEDILDSRMISDTVVMHPGKFKILFGAAAPVPLRCEFKVIKSSTGRNTDNELKVAIVDIIRNFFDIDQWEFGETFYATELTATIHANLPGEIDSIVLVPTASTNFFGELYEIIPDEDELFLPSISVSDIVIVEHYNNRILKQG